MVLVLVAQLVSLCDELACAMRVVGRSTYLFRVACERTCTLAAESVGHNLDIVLARSRPTQLSGGRLRLNRVVCVRGACDLMAVAAYTCPLSGRWIGRRERDNGHENATRNNCILALRCATKTDTHFAPSEVTHTNSNY